MPYIPKRHRQFAFSTPKTPGELNYSISDRVDYYISMNGISYDTYNTIIGVLECAKLEVYRRLVAEYEDVKLHQNGEVYEKTMKAKNVGSQE